MTSRENSHESHPIRANLSIVIRACSIWPLSFALERDRLECNVWSRIFSIHLFPILLRLSSEEWKTSRGSWDLNIKWALCHSLSHFQQHKVVVVHFFKRSKGKLINVCHNRRKKIDFVVIHIQDVLLVMVAFMEFFHANEVVMSFINKIVTH